MYFVSLLQTILACCLFYHSMGLSIQRGSLKHRGYVRSISFNSRIVVASMPNPGLDDNSFGPPCIIVAGLPDDHLETIDDIFSAALGTLPPVIIVNDRDFKTKVSLRTLLESREERDHSLSHSRCSLLSPVIIFAGCKRSAIRLSIQSYKNWDPPTSGALPKAAFAVVVHPALDKTIQDLCEEILGDFKAEQLKRST